MYNYCEKAKHGLMVEQYTRSVSIYFLSVEIGFVIKVYDRSSKFSM